MKIYPDRETVATVLLGGTEKISNPEDVKRALPIPVYFGEGPKETIPIDLIISC